jgi:uncharacterized protein involved in exopolysaccharide biosynthesis
MPINAGRDLSPNGKMVLAIALVLVLVLALVLALIKTPMSDSKIFD